MLHSHFTSVALTQSWACNMMITVATSLLHAGFLTCVALFNLHNSHFIDQ